MDLGRKIQELRRGQGLSQERLAEQMAVSRQAISKWESGGAIPEVDKVGRTSPRPLTRRNGSGPWREWYLP